jgi:hypothetical protein
LPFFEGEEEFFVVADAVGGDSDIEETGAPLGKLGESRGSRSLGERETEGVESVHLGLLITTEESNGLFVRSHLRVD